VNIFKWFFILAAAIYILGCAKTGIKRIYYQSHPNILNYEAEIDEDSLRVGFERFYDSTGRLVGERFYKNGEWHGIHRKWHNGVLIQEIEYKNGLLDGCRKDWYDSGKIGSVSCYRKNMLHGHLKHWDKAGTIFFSCVYSHGKVVKTEVESEDLKCRDQK